MQEDLEQRTVSVSIQAAKLSGRVLRAAIAAVLQKMEQERTMPRVGRNSMKRLDYICFSWKHNGFNWICWRTCV